MITRNEEHYSNVLIEDTSQEPLADQSVGQVEAGQGEREADEVQTEQENHCLLFSFSLQLTEDKFLQPLYI